MLRTELFPRINLLLPVILPQRTSKLNLFLPLAQSKNAALKNWRTSKTVAALISSLHHTANHPWKTLKTYISQWYWLRIYATRTPSARCKEVTWSPKWGLDLRVLQSLVHRLLGFDMVRPFNNLFSFRNSWLLGKVYYQIYADDSEMPKKSCRWSRGPSLGRIRADSIAPPHSPTSIKLCISRVEGKPALVNSDLFAGTTCVSPLKESHISIFHTDGPGLSPDEPMSIVKYDIQVTSIPDGRYLIKNRAVGIYWSAASKPNRTVCFFFCYPTTENAKDHKHLQVNEHFILF